MVSIEVDESQYSTKLKHKGLCDHTIIVKKSFNGMMVVKFISNEWEWDVYVIWWRLFIGSSTMQMLFFIESVLVLK